MIKIKVRVRVGCRCESQHYDAYRPCMVVGAGIGMTPCASILR